MSSARTWTEAEAASIVHVYRGERRRLLDNSRCSAGLERRLAPFSMGYFANGRKATQREMSRLRSNWSDCLAALNGAYLSEAR